MNWISKKSESSKIEYENTLKISGYKDRLVYENSSVNENDKHEKKKKRKRNIICYNPPYSANVKTNIGKTFLNYWTSISQEDTNFLEYLIITLLN